MSHVPMSTPFEINDSVKLVCASIGSSFEPVYVDVIPLDGATVNNCHLNVDALVATKGGKALRGWCIWECAGFLVEGMAHSVWEQPGGDVIDPTPQLEKEEVILFLQDDRVKWEGRLIPSHRVALSSVRWVKQKIAIAEGFEQLNLRYTRGNVRMDIPAVEFLEVILANTSKNDPCFCDSGIRFKHCCAGKSPSQMLSDLAKKGRMLFGQK